MLRLSHGAGQIAAGGGSEFKRIGKLAASQIFGSKPQEPNPAENQAASANTGFSILNELKLLGKTTKSQLGGGTIPLGAGQIAQMAKRDEEFSAKSADEIREKIFRIYREYEEKRKRERMAQQEQEKIEAAKQKEEALQLQKKRQITPINVQVAKTRAEIGKNYGAE